LSGTSTACSRSASRGTTSRVRWCVEASTTGGAAFAVGPKPVHGSDAPTVAGHESREQVLRNRRRQVVADGALVLQELSDHYGANSVPAEVPRPRGTAAVAVEAGERVAATRF
jgi:hypothetical protein